MDVVWSQPPTRAICVSLIILYLPSLFLFLFFSCHYSISSTNVYIQLYITWTHSSLINCWHTTENLCSVYILYQVRKLLFLYLLRFYYHHQGSLWLAITHTHTHTGKLFVSGSLDGSIVIWQSEVLNPLKVLFYPEKYFENHSFVCSINHLLLLSQVCLLMICQAATDSNLISWGADVLLHIITIEISLRGDRARFSHV